MNKDSAPGIFPHFCINMDAKISVSFFTTIARTMCELSSRRVKTYSFLFLFFLPLSEAASQLQAQDTVNIPSDSPLSLSVQQIPEIVVSDFDYSKPLLQRDGPASHIPESMGQRFPNRSIAYRLNTRAGVTVQERAPSSYRISIRGSSLRSPFGVRNVKVYWNGMPFTRANGVTPLQLLDPEMIGRTDILKGPMGSRFGAGNGGVLFFHRPAHQHTGLDVGSTQGSYGLNRHHLHYRDTFQSGRIWLAHARQAWDGYRDHSAMQRQNTIAHMEWTPDDRQELSFSIFHSNLFYELPGGLTREQMMMNPRAARAGAESQNSSIDRSSTYFSGQHRMQWSKHWKSQAVIYLRTHQFDHPFILDYKQETGYGLGGRWSIQGQQQWGRHRFEFTAGMELQSEQTTAANFGNRNGQRDSLRFLDDLSVQTGFLYQEVRWKPSQRWTLTAGLSQNRSAYAIDRATAAGARPAQSGGDRYPIYLLPRIALQFQPNPQSTLFAHWSRGASIPTLSEVRTNEGSINRSLRPERGQNLEMGGRLHHSRIQLNGSVYYFRLSETITNYTNPQGVVLFQNAGATDQWGAELEWKWQLLPWTHAMMADLHIQQALTYQSFQFRDYMRNDEDYSGNALPGVTPYTVFTQVYAESKMGIYTSISHRWTDRLPLNDANSVYQASIHFLTARLGYQFSLGPRLSGDLFAGIDNILDQSFSFGNDLNAFGQRFFQPAPGRNYYGGIRLQYTLPPN